MHIFVLKTFFFRSSPFSFDPQSRIHINKVHVPPNIYLCPPVTLSWCRACAICKWTSFGACFIGRKKIAGERISSHLTALMKSLLCIPHSNTSSEKTFSMVRKTVTENRTSLHNDTVCALLSCKLNCDCSATGSKPSK